jgi:hypothetical protein
MIPHLGERAQYTLTPGTKSAKSKRSHAQSLKSRKSRKSRPYKPMFPYIRASCALALPEYHHHSFHQLHSERVYLLGVLQEENDKATEFLRRIPPLEETLASTTSLHIQRSIKKQLSWLKSRIKETTSQEKSILTRLGHLSHEIQEQERWNQVLQERLWNIQILRSPESLTTNTYPRMEPTGALNTLSPDFQPQPPGYFVPYLWIPQQIQTFDSYGPFAVPQPGPIYNAEMRDQTSSGDETFKTESSADPDQSAESKTKLMPPMLRRSSSMGIAECDMLATHSPLLLNLSRRASR